MNFSKITKGRHMPGKKMLRTEIVEANEPSKFLEPTLVVGPGTENSSSNQHFQGLDSSSLVLDGVDCSVQIGQQQSSRELKNSNQEDEFIPVDYDSDSSNSDHGDDEPSACKSQCHQNELENPNSNQDNVLFSRENLNEHPSGIVEQSIEQGINFQAVDESITSRVQKA